MRIALITGTSKGLGESIANYLLESYVHVIGVSRTENLELQAKAKEYNVNYIHLTTDLTNANEVEQMIVKANEILNEYEEVTSFYIINNAGMLEPMNQAKEIDSEKLIKHFQINTLTPMMITNTFLKLSEKAEYTLTIANITSGAAAKAIYGWSAYSSSKASLNAYTQTVGIEQDVLKTYNKIFAFSPGIMDTDMQKHIRIQDKDAFIEVENFKNYKKSNLLKDTDVVAGVFLDILTSESEIRNGEIYNITDYI